MKNNIHILRFRTVNRDVFEAIKNGTKKVETRAATEKYRAVQAEDVLRLVCGKQEFTKKVKRANVYRSIRSMLQKYKVQHINPKVTTEKKLREIYYSFPGYREKIKRVGLIAFELE